MAAQDLLPSNKEQRNEAERGPPAEGCTHPALLARSQNQLLKIPK